MTQPTLLQSLRLKKGEDRRIRKGHPWIYSNEIDVAATPLKAFSPGQAVIVETYNRALLGAAYVNPRSLIAARMFSEDPTARLDDAFFIQKLRQALDFRRFLFPRPYYRLVFGEADQLPGLVIDRFDADFVMQINTAGMDVKTDDIIQALLQVCPGLRSILLRNDSPVRAQEGLILETKAVGDPPEEIAIEENGVRFKAPLWQGQKTGWFYDHRLNRARLQQYAIGKKVLDVFSYVGGWGIQAAVAGATQVDCIETSALACQFIHQNSQLNQVNHKVNVISEDAFDAMKQLVQTNKQYEVIVLDPPAFVKKSKDRQAGLIAYQRLNELALKLLAPHGILMTCSCSMQVSIEDLLTVLQRAAYRTESKLQIIERGHQGPDHPTHLYVPETDYLKVLMMRKL